MQLLETIGYLIGNLASPCEPREPESWRDTETQPCEDQRERFVGEQQPEASGHVASALLLVDSVAAASAD